VAAQLQQQQGGVWARAQEHGGCLLCGEPGSTWLAHLAHQLTTQHLATLDSGCMVVGRPGQRGRAAAASARAPHLLRG
jgi:hypothetical protein